VAWVSNRNGYRHDLRALTELAHAKGALVYVDGVQALGTFPTNLTDLGVDFACSAVYKWLFAGFGVAPFFIREEHLDRIRPDRYGHGQVAETLTPKGWTRHLGAGRFSELDFRLLTTARKYEYFCLAYSTIVQLAVTFGLFKKVGISRIEEHAMPLAHELRDDAAELGFETWTPKGNGSPIVSFVQGQDIEDLKRLLKEEAISVSFREKNETLMRVSVSMFNNRADVQRLLNLLQRVA
jgi:selenocysteine lyase/cysteine desulfurase